MSRSWSGKRDGVPGGTVRGDEVFRAYGGRSLHQRWHGESFLALFQNQLNPSRPALYLFDEPESALSTIAQFAFLRLLKRWETSGQVQVIVATHSPILLAIPPLTSGTLTAVR